MNTKIERVEKLLRYLIYIEELPISDLQKVISQKTGANKVSVSRALSGNEEYLTNNFIERLNSKFGNHFELDWLLKQNGDMIKNVNIGHTTSGDNSQVSGAISVNDGKIELEIAKRTIEHLEQRLKDKEDIIEILKSKK